MRMVLNGLSQGALFFVLGSGLTLAFGLMRVINLSHGALYLLGGYIGYTVEQVTGSWLLAVFAGAAAIGLFALIFEKSMLVRMRGQDLPQTLLTLAIAMVIADVTQGIWGGDTISIYSPIVEPITLFGVTYPAFRYLLMGIAAFIAIVLWILLFKTKMGAAVRASVDDRETVSALGVRIDLIYTAVFVLSGILAGVAGVLGATYLQVSPGADATILTYALVVIIVGGMGSLAGALVSSIILGQILSFGLGYVPQMAMFLVFIPMAIILIVRPQGLFGKGEA